MLKSDVLHSFFIVILLYLVVYLIGFIFNYVVNRKFTDFSWVGTSLNFTFGTILLIFFFAIWKCHFITVLAPIPFLLFFISPQLTIHGTHLKVPRPEKKIIYGQLLFLLFATLLYFTINVLILYNPNPGNFNYIAGDFTFYYRVAEYIKATGIESLQLGNLFALDYGPTAYHYGDLWFLAIVQDLMKSQPVLYQLVTLPFFITLISLGSLSVLIKLRNIRQIPSFYYFFIFTGLFSAFTIFYPTFLLNVDNMAFGFIGKWCLLALIFTSLLLTINDKNLIGFSGITFIVGLMYLSAFPTICLTSFLWILYRNRVWKKDKLVKELGVFVMISLGVVIFLISLYKFYPDYFHKTTLVLSNSNININKELFVTMFHVFVGGFLQIFTFLIFSIFICMDLYLNKSKITRQRYFSYLIYWVISFVSGLFCYTLFIKITAEAVQLFSVVLNTGCTIIMAVIIIDIVYKNKFLIVKLLGSIFLVLCCFRNYGNFYKPHQFSRKELSSIQKFIKEEEGVPLFANFKEYSSEFTVRNTAVYQPISVLSYYIPDYTNVSLDAPFEPLDPAEENYNFLVNQKEWAPLSVYIKLNKLDSLPLSEIIYKFLKEKDVDYITTPLSYKLPNYLKNGIKDSLLLPEEGWKIFRCSFNEQSLPKDPY